MQFITRGWTLDRGAAHARQLEFGRLQPRAQLRHREILEVAQRPERLRRPPALEELGGDARRATRTKYVAAAMTFVSMAAMASTSCRF